MRDDLQFSLNYINFTHISAIFLSSNDILKAPDSIQQKKFNKLLTECKLKQDAENVIFNFSNVFLNEPEKLLLVFKFLITAEKVPYSDHLVKFELFCTSIDKMKTLSRENLDYIKAKNKDLAL